MSKNPIFLLILSAMATSGAGAQQMYKTVGPDGKVTFSDRPAFKEAKKVSVMHSYTLRPYGTTPPPAEPSAETPRKVVAAPAAAVVASPVLTQEVEDAMVTVMGQVEFGRRFYNFCNSTVAGAKAFNAALHGWKKRNAASVEHQKRLLMEVVSPAKRDELLDKTAAMLGEESAKVSARNPKERQVWCAGAIAELESGKADIAQPAMMAVPIVQYRGK